MRRELIKWLKNHEVLLYRAIATAAAKLGYRYENGTFTAVKTEGDPVTINLPDLPWNELFLRF